MHLYHVLARHGAKKQVARSRYPQLERLEDRLVPSIPDGSLLVPTYYLSATIPGPAKIIEVTTNPVQQILFTTLGLSGHPSDITEAPSTWSYGYGSDTLYFTDSQANTVDAINPNDGSQWTTLAQGNLLNGPVGIVVIGNYLYVCNQGDNTAHTIVRIDPSNGNQTLMNSGGDGSTGFLLPTAMYRVPGTNQVYLVDEQQRWLNAYPPPPNEHGKIWKINPTMRDDPGRVVASGAAGAPDLDIDETTDPTNDAAYDGLNPPGPNTEEDYGQPQDIVLDANGNLIVSLAGDFSEGGLATTPLAAVVWINPSTGNQYQDVTGLTGGDNGMEIGSDGTIYVDDIQTTGQIAQIVTVTTSGQTVLTSGGYLAEVGGMAIFHPNGTGNTPPPPSAAPWTAVQISQSPTKLARAVDVQSALNTSAAAQTPPLQLASQPLAIPAAGEKTGSILRPTKMRRDTAPTILDSFFVNYASTLGQEALLRWAGDQGSL